MCHHLPPISDQNDQFDLETSLLYTFWAQRYALCKQIRIGGSAKLKLTWGDCVITHCTQQWRIRVNGKLSGKAEGKEAGGGFCN